MQIEIRLAPHEESLLSFDYLYALHAAIMKTIDSFRPEMAESLHEGVHKNKMKLFTFSPLNSYPLPKLVQVEGESRKRMLLGQKVWFRIASPWPELLNSIGESLLKSQNIKLLNKSFQITQINMIAPPEFKEEMVWMPFGQSGSVCTSWSSKDTERKLFIYPDKRVEDSPDCANLLENNLYHKFQRFQEIRPDIATAWLKDAGIETISSEKTPISIEFMPLAKDKPYKTTMHYGKNTVIKSWRCPVKVTAPIPIQRLIWACGLGDMNSQGYGLMEEGR